MGTLQGKTTVSTNAKWHKTKPEFVELLKPQLGNTGLRYDDRVKLAALLETDGAEDQPYKPRFYTYDDTPCFNLVSGIMQAQEAIEQRESVRRLETEVLQLQKQAQVSETAIGQLKEEVRALESAKQNKRGVTLGKLGRSASAPPKLRDGTEEREKPLSSTDPKSHRRRAQSVIRRLLAEEAKYS